MGVPLQEVSGGGQGDDEAGAQLSSGGAADEFGGGLDTGPHLPNPCCGVQALDAIPTRG